MMSRGPTGRRAGGGGGAGPTWGGGSGVQKLLSHVSQVHFHSLKKPHFRISKVCEIRQKWSFSHFERFCEQFRSFQRPTPASHTIHLFLLPFLSLAPSPSNSSLPTPFIPIYYSGHCQRFAPRVHNMPFSFCPSFRSFLPLAPYTNPFLSSSLKCNFICIFLYNSGHCQRFAPEYERVAQALQGIVPVVAVNADTHR
jgi:thiol-disulfide isomerase/thioredoxin